MCVPHTRIQIAASSNNSLTLTTSVTGSWRALPHPLRLPRSLPMPRNMCAYPVSLAVCHVCAAHADPDRKVEYQLTDDETRRFVLDPRACLTYGMRLDSPDTHALFDVLEVTLAEQMGTGRHDRTMSSRGFCQLSLYSTLRSGIECISRMARRETN
jgi:hypothetical protein